MRCRCGRLAPLVPVSHRRRDLTLRATPGAALLPYSPIEAAVAGRGGLRRPQPAETAPSTTTRLEDGHRAQRDPSAGTPARGTTPGRSPPAPAAAALADPRAHFNVRRRGFDPVEIRAFLHQVADELAVAQTALVAVQEENVRIKNALRAWQSAQAANRHYQ